MEILAIDAARLWSAVAVHLWQTTLVLAVLIVLDRLLVRAPARYRVALWWLGVIKLAVPAAWLSSLLPASEGLREAPAVVTGIRLVVQPLEPVLRPAVLRTPGWPAALLLATWGAGALAMVAILAMRWIRSRRVELDPDLSDSVRRAAEQCGVDARRVRTIPGSGVPCLIGIVRPRILIPESAALTLRPAELRAVLLHEEAHRRRRDPLRQFLLLPVLIAYWFYPPAWWLLRRLGEAEESACDEAVLAAGIPAPVYSGAIARAVGHALEIPFGAASLAGAGRGALARRLREIPDLHRRTTMSRHRVALVLALAAIAAAALLSDTVTLPAIAGEQQASVGLVAGSGGGVPTSEAQEGVAVIRKRDHTIDLLGDAVTVTISLDMDGEPLEIVLDEIALAGGFDVVLNEGVDEGQTVTITLDDATIRSALGIVAASTGVAYSVDASGTLEVWSGQESLAEGDESPERLEYVAPKYPDEARRDGVMGTVVLEIKIDGEGNVASAEIQEGVREDLDTAARDAVLQWKYASTIEDGEAVEVLLTVTVKFLLR